MPNMRLTRTIGCFFALIACCVVMGVGPPTASAAVRPPTTGNAGREVHPLTSQSGQHTCNNSQYTVHIVSSASGKVTHSFSKGPEHLGYKVYRDRFGGPYYNFQRETDTGFQSVYWQVTAVAYGGAPGTISDAFAACIHKNTKAARR